MQTQFLVRPGGKIAFDDSGGEGEVVIMLPGMGALRSEYRYLAPVVADSGYRVVTADLRGHGESTSFWPDYTLIAAGEDLLALIDHLDAGSAHVIGTSFSPGAAVWAAAERVRDAQPSFFQKVLTAALLSGPWKASGWMMYYKTLYPSQQPDDFEDYLSQLRANLKEPGRFEALKKVGFAPKKDSETRLGAVKAPALVIMGTSDPDWPDPEEEARFIADRLSAELVLIDGAGHYPQTERPEEVTPFIVDFLTRQSSASQA
jgi:pimeloyl-ACP methyl ester carboxylesterase